MEFKILENCNNKLRFVVEGIGIPVANSLRRTMIAEVPSMAIEDIVIIENASPIRDEILAHRLGLVPLKTDLESYVIREKCDCHSELGCSKCGVILTLEVEAIDVSRTVYSKEFKSSDPEIIPVSGEIPLLKLARNQRVRLEAYARLGLGSEHAKWQPVSACTVKPLSKIIINTKNCNDCGKCINECQKQVLKSTGQSIEIIEVDKCNNCMKCIESCPKDAIKIESSNVAVVFEIESTGVLSPEQIFDKAIEILQEKTQEFVDQVSNLKVEEV